MLAGARSPSPRAPGGPSETAEIDPALLPADSVEREDEPVQALALIGPLRPGAPTIPARAPATSPRSEPPATAPRRRPALIAASAVAVLITLALVAVVAGRDEQEAPRPSATPEDGTRESAGEAPVPDDWVSYRDPETGFTISHPPGWTIRRNGTLTDFRDPQTGAYLRVDFTRSPGPSPQADWEAFEPRFAAENAGYRRIRIEPTTYAGYPAAIWEFTYSSGGAELRAVDLGFVTGRYGFALNFQSRSADWDRYGPTFDALKASFRAPA